MPTLRWFASAGARAVPARAARTPGWWASIEVALLCACLLAASGCSRRKPASEPEVQQPNRVPMRTQNTPSTNPQRPPGLAGAMTPDMGAGGTDVALETADVVLMSSDLSKLPFVVNLSRKAAMQRHLAKSEEGEAVQA